MITLFIDTSSNRLVSALGGETAISPMALPFYAGDTGLTMQVYFLTPLIDPVQGRWGYSVILTPGNTCYAQIDDGTFTGNIYTDQTVWSSDPNNQYFIANFPMNTTANVGGGGTGIIGLLGSARSVTAYLRIGLSILGNPLTALNQQITIKAGIPNNPVQVAPPLTPLSLQVANTLYVPIAGTPGGGFFLVTPLGGKIWVCAVDNPDGTPTFQATS